MVTQYWIFRSPNSMIHLSPSSAMLILIALSLHGTYVTLEVYSGEKETHGVPHRIHFFKVIVLCFINVFHLTHMRI